MQQAIAMMCLSTRHTYNKQTQTHRAISAPLRLWMEFLVQLSTCNTCQQVDGPLRMDGTITDWVSAFVSMHVSKECEVDMKAIEDGAQYGS